MTTTIELPAPSTFATAPHRDSQNVGPFAHLTCSERRVLTLLAQGLAPKQAAWELHVAISTVRSHIASAKRKSGARTLQQMVGAFAATAAPAAATKPARRSKTRDPAQKDAGIASSANTSESARVAASPSPNPSIHTCSSR